MSKKTAVIALSAAVLIVLTAVLLMNTGGGSGQDGLIEVNMDADIISSDHTVFPDFIYNADAIQSDSIAGSRRCEAENIEKPGAEQLIQGSADVVRAEVVSLSYTFIDGRAWTQADICISEVLKGNQEIGNYISVYFPGGYASVADYNSFYKNSAAGDENKYYSFDPPYGRLPYQEDDLLLFLSPSKGEKALPSGAYILSFGHYSVFNVLDEGKLVMQDENYIDYGKIQALFK